MSIIHQWNKVIPKAGEIRDAMLAIAEEYPVAAADIAHPRFHFTIPARYMMDVWGVIYYQEAYHMFYMLDPYNNKASWVHGNGQAKSKNLIDWEYMPIAILPDSRANEIRVNDGFVALDENQTPFMMYTRVFDDEGLRPFEHLGVTGSKDMCVWTRDEDNPILTLSMGGTPDFFVGSWSDPYLFETDGRKFMIMAHCKREDGSRFIPIYESVNGNLRKWEYRGIFFEQSGEVVNFVPCGDGKWLLTFSVWREPEWFVGTFDTATLEFKAEKHGILSLGYHDEFSRGFYAPNLFLDNSGRITALGWVHGFPSAKGWDGCCSLPRHLIWDGERIRMVPHPVVEELHTGISDEGVRDGDTYRFEGYDGCADCNFVVKVNESGTVSISIKGNDAVPMQITYVDEKLTVNGVEYALPSYAGKEFDLRMIIDRSVYEIFVENGRTSITVCAEGVCDPCEIVMECVNAEVHSAQVYKMRDMKYDSI